LSGAYSSIFIASPLLAILKEREPRFKELALRVASRTEVDHRMLTPAAAARLGAEGAQRAVKSTRTSSSQGVIARGRKQKRR
jgi:preprotein translocase subunit SecF